MKLQHVAFVIVLTFVVVQSLTAQRKSVNRTQPATKRTALKHGPVYEMHLKISTGGKLYVSMLSPEIQPAIDPLDLTHLIADLPSGADGLNKPSTAFPKVVVEAEPSISMLELWNPITLFRRGYTDIRMFVPNGLDNNDRIEIAIPWNDSEPKVNVKPNPLFLVVKVRENGELSLNNDPAGTLNNTKQLSDHLHDIFRAREANGVFRDGTNDVEKSVNIIMPMSDRKVSDLISVARAIWLPGGDRISLSMDDPFDDDMRKSLIDVPLVPAKKKP